MANTKNRSNSKNGYDNEETAKPKWTARRKAIAIVASTLALLLLLTIGLVGYGFSILSAMRENPNDFKPKDIVETTNAPEELEGLEELNPQEIQGPLGDVASDPNITNVMLFGLDTRSKTELDSGLTDVMIILSLDKDHNKIKLTSIMRDILVQVPGSKTLARVNTLFGRLGPLKAAQTIGEYFGVKIDHYATVNFACTASIVDTLGGVDINVTNAEIDGINDNLKSELYRDGSHQMKKGAGVRHLDGAQAVAYARIRKNIEGAGGDYARTQRQRNVLLACVDKLPGMSSTQVLSLIEPVSKFVRTNLTEMEMINFATILYGLRSGKPAQLRIPIDNTWKDKRYNGAAILDIDFQANHDAVQQFIFKDILIDQKDED